MIREDLRGLVEGASPEALPDLIGDLEAVTARARARLMRVETSAPTAREHDEPLTVPQVAEILGASPDYVYGLVRQGRLPTVRLPGLREGEKGRGREGKLVRVLRSSLEAWLKAHEEDETARLERGPLQVLRSRRSAGGGA